MKQKITNLKNFCAICTPEGDIIYTSLAPDGGCAIEFFVDTEKTMNWIRNEGRKSRGEPQQPLQSWEEFEKEGYFIGKVDIVSSLA